MVAQKAAAVNRRLRPFLFAPSRPPPGEARARGWVKRSRKSSCLRKAASCGCGRGVTPSNVQGLLRAFCCVVGARFVPGALGGALFRCALPRPPRLRWLSRGQRHHPRQKSVAGSQALPALHPFVCPASLVAARGLLAAAARPSQLSAPPVCCPPRARNRPRTPPLSPPPAARGRVRSALGGSIPFASRQGRCAPLRRFQP